MRPQQPTSCTPSFNQFRVIVTLVPVMLSTAPVCVTHKGMFQLQYPSSWKCALPRQGDVRHGIRLKLCLQRDVRWPRLQRAKLSPLFLPSWKEAQTLTLSGRASARACKREPDVTGAPVQIILRPGRVRQTNGRVRMLLAIPGVGLQRENHGDFSWAHIQRCHSVFFLRHQRVYSQQL